ncbi:MAG: hypothetical protein ACKVRN_13425 [Pyrinomonadaceae bacterium]
MSKQSLAKIFAVLMISLITCSDALADIRVRFARGRTSATMSGSLRSGGSVCYVAGARRGQTLNATLSSRNGRVTFSDSGETSYSQYLDWSGDHTFCVNNDGRATTYTLTVSIQ